MSAVQKVALVTGSNRGLGLAIVRKLLQNNPTWTVYLTSRDKAQGQEAVNQLKKEITSPSSLRFQQLDVRDAKSIGEAVNALKAEHRQGIDVLINNAGIFPIPSAYPLNRSQNYIYNSALGRATVDTNFFSLMNVTNQFLPLMKKDSSIVNVAAILAQIIFRQFSPELKTKVLKLQNGSIESLVGFMRDFADLPPSDYASAGFMTKPSNTAVMPGFIFGDIVPYAVSKMGVILLSQLMQKEIEARQIVVNSCCPGSVKTDMNKGGMATAEKGADTPVFLANLPSETKIRGQFVTNRRVVNPFQ